MARGEEILEAAFRFFAEKGYDATSIQDITSAVNIKKATFYSHFQSKKELFILIMEEQAKLLLDKTEEALKKTKAKDIKGILFDVFITNVKISSKSTRLLFWKRAVLVQAELSDNELKADLIKIMGRVNGLMVSAISSAINAVRADISYEVISHCILLFMVFLQGYLDLILITNKTDTAQAKHAWECFWNGMQYCIAGNKKPGMSDGSLE